MKLIIQIPCYNEAQTLPETLADLPRQVPGVDTVEWMIIDDGSTDATRTVARQHGVDHIVGFSENRGLASAFMLGLESALRAGADIIVNTDADNQYRAEFIPDLVAPIVEGQADIVVGTRPIKETEEFSRIKKLLQRFGSWTVRRASGTGIPDAPSGFRAFSRYAAMRMNVFNRYTYTLETIIQAGQKGIPIASVPVQTNPARRPSRLVKSIPSYVYRSILTIARIFVVYRPFRFFITLGGIMAGLGTLIGLRFLYFYAIDQGQGHVQSLILASILIGVGFQTMLTAFIADLIQVNRLLLEEVQFRERECAQNRCQIQGQPASQSLGFVSCGRPGRFDEIDGACTIREDDVKS